MMHRFVPPNGSSRRQSQGLHRSGILHPRTGSVFEYYFAYLLLTSLILSASGFCIHLLMKAFDDQSTASRFIHATLSVSRQLRSDDDASITRQVADGRLHLTLTNPAGVSEQVEWRAEKCVLVRRTTSSERSFENRFVFPLGTTIRIFLGQDQRCVLLVRDPVPPNTDLERPVGADAESGNSDNAALSSPEDSLLDGLVEPHAFEVVLGEVI